MDRRIAAAAGAGGFTLIEVLVTVLILSVGLLGIAALQVASMRGTQSAYFRSQAAISGQQISEAMRANRDAATSGAYATGFGDGASCDGDASVVACDLSAWKSALSTRLPAGDGAVSVDGNDVVTVCIRWSEPDRADEIAASTDNCGAVPAGTRQFEFQTEL